MKKFIKLTFLCFAMLLICMLSIACGKDGNKTDSKKDYHTDIRVSSEFTYEEGIFKTSVSSTAEKYNLLSKIEAHSEATIQFSKSYVFDSPLDGSNLELQKGDNFYYVKVSNKRVSDRIYRFNIYRNSLVTVSFNTNGGSPVDSVSLETGSKITPPVTVKTGYTLRWNYDFGVPVTEDMIINAEWTPNNYQITLKNDADDNGILIGTKFDESYDLSDKIQNKTGYKTSLYYLVDGKEMDFAIAGEYRIPSNVTLFTKYKPIEYTITYNVDSNVTNPNNVVKFTVEDVISLQDAEWKNGAKTFAGWYLTSDCNEADKITSINNVAHDITLWAKFDPILVKVNCYTNDSLIEQYEFEYYSEYSLKDPAPIKGYKFVGWYLGDAEIESTGIWMYPDAQIRLDAKFEARKYSIEYVLAIGSQNNSENVNEYNADMGVIQLKNPSFGEGILHEFKGWYLDAEYTKPITELSLDTVTEGMTIYARWQYVTKVTLNTDGADCDVTEFTLKYGEEYSLPVLSKAGYIFYGWFYEGTSAEVERTGEWSNRNARISLVAKFEARKHSIEYVLGNAQNNSENVNEYNADMGVIQLKDPTFGEGVLHEFKGWYLDAECTIPITELSLDTVTDEMVIYAKWQYISKVTLNPNGVDCDTTELTIKFGEEYSLPLLSKKGYIFRGWFYEGSSEEIERAGKWSKKDAEISLVAKFEARKHGIEYVLGNAQNNSENVNEYNADMGVIQLKDPSFGDHKFLGWYLDAECTKPITELSVETVTEEMTLYPKWQYVSNVSFDMNGSTQTIEKTQYLYGTEYTLPSPIKAGCLFGGWYIENVQVFDGAWTYRTDVTLKAKWIPTNINIEYELNGGTQNSSNPSEVGVYTGIVVLKDPTHDNLGFKFDGWYTDSDFNNKITEIDTAIVREIKLYAKWIGRYTNIELNAGSGYVTTDKITINYGTTYSLPTPERPGYNFTGWICDGQPISSVGTWEMISENISLEAQWEIIDYTINYDLGGYQLSDVYTTVIDAQGNVQKVPVSLTYQYDVTDTFVIPQLFKDGYIFLGWQTSTGLVQEITIVNGSTGNRNYVASWIVAKDEDTGITFAITKNQEMMIVDYMKNPGSKQSVDMPSEYGGVPVRIVATNAFSAFGLEYGETLKKKNYYFTIVLPMTITEIQTDAFINCNGICVSLRDDNGTVLDFKSEDVLKEWEKNVKYAEKNKNVKQVRDCIWGFRPALGWTRFSAVIIPDDYE